MTKPKKSLQQILDDMRDLHDKEDDLLQEMEDGFGSLTSSDLDDIDFEDEE